MDFKYIIIGSGFAGSVIAERIANDKKENVLLIEKRSHIGGNCYDFNDENNIIVHKYGPHLLHTNNSEVFSYLSKFTNWRLYNHKVVAYIDGVEVNIPFNFNSLHRVFPDAIAQRVEEKLVKAYPFNSKVPILELKKNKDEDLSMLADYIYEKVFLNYTAKQWGVKPEEIDKEVTARVPVFIGKDDRYFNDKYQAVPQRGYTKLFENMLSSNRIKIMLNTDFNEVCNIKDGKLFFMNKEFKGRLIYTGQVDELFDLKFGELPYRSIDMKFETVDSEFFQDATVVNYPNNYDFTRITEFKYIHPVSTSKTTILKEYPRPYIRGENLPYYPIFNKENKIKYEKYLEYSKNIDNLILLGRLAEYRYYDMDDIVERALYVYTNMLK